MFQHTYTYMAFFVTVRGGTAYQLVPFFKRRTNF